MTKFRESIEAGVKMREAAWHAAKVEERKTVLRNLRLAVASAKAEAFASFSAKTGMRVRVKARKAFCAVLSRSPQTVRYLLAEVLRGFVAAFNDDPTAAPSTGFQSHVAGGMDPAALVAALRLQGRRIEEDGIYMADEHDAYILEQLKLIVLGADGRGSVAAAELPDAALPLLKFLDNYDPSGEFVEAEDEA